MKIKGEKSMRSKGNVELVGEKGIRTSNKRNQKKVKQTEKPKKQTKQKKLAPSEKKQFSAKYQLFYVQRKIEREGERERERERERKETTRT